MFGCKPLTAWVSSPSAQTPRLALCPVVGLAIDSRTDVPDAAEAVRRILDDWHSNLIRLLVEDGYSRVRARRLATMIVASIEGALILCRAKRSVTPLNDVSSEIHLLLNIGE